MLRRTKKRNLSVGSSKVKKGDEDITLKANNEQSGSNVSHNKKSKKSQDKQLNEGLEKLVFGGLIPETDQKVSLKHKACKIKPVWSDDDDNDISIHKSKISLSINVNSRRDQFEKTLGPTPKWAQVTVAQKQDGQDDILPTKYLTDSALSLPKESIDIIRCVNLNKQQPSSIGLEVCEFHHSSQIAMTASQDCGLHLFQVDGKNNAKIHGLFMESFPIKCAHFLSNGTEILITSSRVRWMYSYDMMSGKMNKLPFIRGLKNAHFYNYKVSPDKKHLVFLSSYGTMQVLDSATKELVTTLKMNGSVDDIDFTHDGRNMLSIGDEGIVHVWDMNTRQCIHTFVDEGCVKGTSIAISAKSNVIACGSYSGIVNVYDGSCLLQSHPSVLKSFKNLRTPVTALEFNSSSEILAMASNVISNAVKLAHVPSLSVFANFPEFAPKYLRSVRQINFSPNSGYLSIGNNVGNALLYRLNHYKNY